MGVLLRRRGLGVQGLRYQVVNKTRELTRMTENVPLQGACNILLCKLKAFTGCQNGGPVGVPWDRAATNIPYPKRDCNLLTTHPYLNTLNPQPLF